jgi:hypothetical protein
MVVFLELTRSSLQLVKDGKEPHRLAQLHYIVDTIDLIYTSLNLCFDYSNCTSLNMPHVVVVQHMISLI